MQFESHQPPVPKIMHIRPQVMKHRGRGGGEIGEDFNEPAFLRNKDPAIRRKADRGRFVSPENTTDSENPAGKVAPSTTASVGLRRQANAVQAPPKGD